MKKKNVEINKEDVLGYNKYSNDIEEVINNLKDNFVLREKGK